MYCKTCRFWRGCKGLVSGVGACDHPTTGEDMDRPKEGPDDRLTYPYEEGGAILTGPDFGCVKYQPKEVE